MSFLAKEAEHVDGFAKECAVVTHHRLCTDPKGGGLMPDPEARLEVSTYLRACLRDSVPTYHRDPCQKGLFCVSFFVCYF